MDSPQNLKLSFSPNSNSINCSNCNVVFDLTNNTPYKLGCGHTVCKSCLRACHKDKKDYKCKNDHQIVTVVQLRSLQKNVEVINKLREKKNPNSPQTQNLFPLKARQETQKLLQMRSQEQNELKQESPVSTYVIAAFSDEVANSMNQIKMDFQRNHSSSPKNQTNEDKPLSNLDQMEQQMRSQSPSTSSLHNTYKSNFKMQNHRIEEIVEEESSINNRTNVESLRQSQIRDLNGNGKSIMSIQENGQSPFGNNFQHHELGTINEVEIQINNHMDHINGSQSRRASARASARASPRNSSRQQQMHQEDDVNRHAVHSSRNQNLIDKLEQSHSHVPLIEHDSSINQIEGLHKINNDDSSLGVFQKYLGLENQSQQFTIEVEHVKTNRDYDTEQQLNFNQAPQVEFPVLSNYINNDGEQFRQDSIFTETVQNVNSNENDQIYQNSLGNLTMQTNTDIFRFHSNLSQNPQQNRMDLNMLGGSNDNTRNLNATNPAELNSQMNSMNGHSDPMNLIGSVSPKSANAQQRNNTEGNQRLTPSQSSRHIIPTPILHQNQQMNQSQQSHRQHNNDNIEQNHAIHHTFQEEQPLENGQDQSQIHIHNPINPIEQKINQEHTGYLVESNYESQTNVDSGTIQPQFQGGDQTRMIKGKKKGKKKKKKRSGMTSMVEESYFDYTINQDDADFGEMQTNKSQKSMRSLKNLVNQNNEGDYVQNLAQSQSQQQLLQEALINQNADQFNHELQTIPDTYEDYGNEQQLYNDQMLDIQNDQINQQIVDLPENYQPQLEANYEYRPSLQSYEEMSQKRNEDLYQLQEQLRDLEHRPHPQTLQYVPPHQKYRGSSNELNQIRNQEIQHQKGPQLSTQYNSRIESATSYGQYREMGIVSTSPPLINQNLRGKSYQVQQISTSKIQDGIPPFNKSMGGQYKFQAFSQNRSQGQLPDIRKQIIQNQSVGNNLMQTQKLPIQGNQKLDQQEEFKNDLSSEIPMSSKKSDGALNRLINNNFGNVEKSTYYPMEILNQTDIRPTNQFFHETPPYVPQQMKTQSTDNFDYQKNNVNQFESVNENFVSSPGSRASSKGSIRNQQNLNLSSINEQNQIPPSSIQIIPLQDNCKHHPREIVKYFCRDPGCLKGLCPDCIIEHSKHDFLAANELASFEIKQIVKQAQRKCKNQVRLQKEYKTLTEQKLSQLNRQRTEEFHRLHCYFNELHKELDEREAQLNQLFNEEIRDTESQLMKDMQNIQQVYSENVKLFKRLRQLCDQQQISTEVGVVSNADVAYYLSNLANQKESQASSKQFYVQLEEGKQDLITPTYSFDLNVEKDKIKSIARLISGTIEEGQFELNIQQNLVVATNTHSKRPSASFPVHQLEEQSRAASENLRQSTNNQSFSANATRKSIGQRITREIGVQTIDSTTNHSDSSRMQLVNQAVSPQQSNNLLGEVVSQNNKNIYWFRWDSSEVYRLSQETRQWQIRHDIKNQSKFLFFSSIVHLHNDLGCFIVGGSDNENNYSKRVQYFCKYNVFIEKPPMINKRAFFPSIFARLDNSIYVLGGSDSNQTDLNKCEKFSLIENVWRPIAPMNLSRNGTAAVILDHFRLIFTFGGNNHKVGSLTKIEKYEIDFDKWSLLSIQMKHSIHDLSAFCVGKERVLIFGGHTNTEPSKDVEMIDLSFECFKSKNGKAQNFMMKEGGKTYFPPFYDHSTGKIQLLFGYCDTHPSIEELDISDLVFTGNNTSYHSNIQMIGQSPMSRTVQISQGQNGERRSHSQSRSVRQLLDV